jgi:hypothetical protein
MSFPMLAGAVTRAVREGTISYLAVLEKVVEEGAGSNIAAEECRGRFFEAKRAKIV